MSNVNWFTTRKHMKPAQIGSDIIELLESKFSGLYEIQPFGSKYWDVSIRANGEYYGSTSITYVNRNRITFKPGGLDYSSYLEGWLRSELATKYNGMCGGEFDPKERWKPNPSRYSTYRSYFLEMHPRWKIDAVDYLMSNLPETLRDK